MALKRQRDNDIPVKFYNYIGELNNQTFIIYDVRGLDFKLVFCVKSDFPHLLTCTACLHTHKNSCCWDEIIYFPNFLYGREKRNILLLDLFSKRKKEQKRKSNTIEKVVARINNC